MNAVVRILEWPCEDADNAPLALWNAHSAAHAMEGRASGDFEVAGVAIDSRDVVPGDLFFALNGESTDGHRFVAGASARGAGAAVVDRPVDGPHILVGDTAQALNLLGAAARARSGARIIGVTGSVGKTGVKEALFVALDRSTGGDAHRSLKSYNNHVGVPLSLARLPERARFGVFEMGMNHAGEIAALSALVRPHVALITTDRAGAHRDASAAARSAIADAKAEIFAGLEPGGGLGDHSGRQRSLRASCAPGRADHDGDQVVAFGSSARADVRLLDAIRAPSAAARSSPRRTGRSDCASPWSPHPEPTGSLNSAGRLLAAVRAVGGDLGRGRTGAGRDVGPPGRARRSATSSRSPAAPRC